MNTTNKLFERFQKELLKNSDVLPYLDYLAIPDNQEHEIGFCPDGFGENLSSKTKDEFKKWKINELNNCLIFPLTDSNKDITGFAGFCLKTKKWLFPISGQFQVDGKGTSLYLTQNPIDALILNYCENVNVCCIIKNAQIQKEEYTDIHSFVGVKTPFDTLKISYPEGGFKEFFIKQKRCLSELLNPNSEYTHFSDSLKHIFEFSTNKYIIHLHSNNNSQSLNCKIKVHKSNKLNHSFSDILNLESAKERKIFASNCYEQISISKKLIEKELQLVLNKLDNSKNTVIGNQSKNSSNVSLFEKSEAKKKLSISKSMEYLDSLIKDYWSEDIELFILSQISYLSSNPLEIFFSSDNNIELNNFNSWARSITPLELEENLKFVLGKTNKNYLKIELNQSSPLTQSSTIDSLKTKHYKAIYSSKIKALLSILEPLEVINPYLSKGASKQLENAPKQLVQAYLTLINSFALLHQYSRTKQFESFGEAQIEYVLVKEIDIIRANKLFFKILDATVPTLGTKEKTVLTIVDELPDNTDFTKKDLISLSNEKTSRIRHGLDSLVELGILKAKGLNGQEKRYSLTDNEKKSFPLLLNGACELASLQKENH